MLPLEKFPEVPEGLEKEIYSCYESTVAEHSGDYLYSNYFGAKEGAFGLDEEQARRLDRLVDLIYGTYETTKMLSSNGVHKSKTILDFNVFQTAAAGAYNDTGIVNGGFDNGNFGDYSVLVIIGNKLTCAVQPFISTFFNRKTSELALPETQVEIFKFLKKDALAALEQTLRFEAAIYEAMKKHYGITVEVK